ncbi:DUF2284 domain-containing protein [Pelotalea chapellei]|uniref:O-methyltransferase C-terminal domain-containing protein n=1 Tax=Pelotalea chapellei TaxID=44671 RepID=A0ABS5UBP4_9BACT|nr:DUF2284 domain-containing protein [Pelotalea chapellei]MBT1073114.1 hypothetical protein [Pelotalea chapellei]
MKISPADNSYATFCDLTTGYRLFYLLREACNAGIIDRVAEHACTTEELVKQCGLRAEEGGRFVESLVNVGLLERYDGQLYLSRFAATYLASTSPENQVHVLEFEELLMENWGQLGKVLRDGQGSLIQERSPDEYQRRLNLFQGAMAEAARVRARELWEALPGLPETGLIIDIGAGDGSYLHEFLTGHPGWQALACDLPDVCNAAQSGSTHPNLRWHPINIIAEHELGQLVEMQRGQASLVVLSNLIHCYSAEENSNLLARLAQLTTADGMVIVHDFYTDGNGFGAMYDLHMLVNTFNGRCYTIPETADLLQQAGLPQHTVLELPSRSHAVIAGRSSSVEAGTSLHLLRTTARQLGFHAAVDLDPVVITIEPWVKAKCSYGCSQYGRKWSCPPHSMGSEEFKELLGCYSRALLVAGQPPLRSFQEQLLELEKAAFLGGFKKALAFSGGPCCWCETCPEDRCTFPEKRRPSLESCGCDVFALAERAGIKMGPLKNSDDFVQYVGLLLVE